MRSVFVTGTDTGAGKTLASCTLLHALRARGLRAVGMKPVASGCELAAEGWRNADALALWQASQPRPAYADLNPFALPEPLAPELAARAAGVQVGLEPILAAYARLQAQADAVVVEGVGGWAAPLSASLMQADLVRALQLPVVLVVGLRLGCLNHALLTFAAIRNDNLPVAGWVMNRLYGSMSHYQENLDTLRGLLPAPFLGEIPFVNNPLEADLRGRLDISPLL